MNNKTNTKHTENFNYRIFRVDEEASKGRYRPKKITMKRIYAEDVDDAVAQLKDYRSIANKAYTYYVERWAPIVVIRNGVRHEYDDYVESMQAEFKARPFYKRVWNAIDLFFWRVFVNPISNFRYWIRDTVYLLRHKDTYQSSWNIDDRLLDVLALNIPILKKYKHTLSWKMLDKALLEKHKDEPDFDLQKYHETHYSGYGDDIEEQSVKYEHEMFDNLMADIRAYKYLMNEEYLDSDIRGTEIDKKLRPSLPLIKGSYDDYDYVKLNKMTEKIWNRIWETVRLYGREFND